MGVVSCSVCGTRVGRILGGPRGTFDYRGQTIREYSVAQDAGSGVILQPRGGQETSDFDEAVPLWCPRCRRERGPVTLRTLLRHAERDPDGNASA